MKTTISNTGAKWMVAAFVMALATLGAAQTSSRAGERTRRMVLVSIEDRRLAVLENGKVLAYFPVAVGAAVSPSPIGDFEIVRRVANPVYEHDGLVIPPGKDNPVGTRWIALNVKGYGIHGTNAPRSVGDARSHGCIRLRNHDVEKLYAMVRVGDLVQIRAGRDDEIAAVFGGSPDVAVAQTLLEAGGQ